MINKDLLKKKIIYLSIHRGTKEMDLLLGNFVDKYIHTFNDQELEELLLLLNIDDKILNDWYMRNKIIKNVPISKVTNLLKNFKIRK